jgi:microcystin-dependent protein
VSESSLPSVPSSVSPYQIPDLARRQADQEQKQVEAVVAAIGLQKIRATVVAVDEPNSSIQVMRITNTIADEPFYPVRGGAMPEVDDLVFGFEDSGGPVFIGNLGGGSGVQPPIGSMMNWAGATDPADTTWLICDGRTVSATTYPELLLVLGTTWNIGGEAAGTFRLPDLRGRVAVGAGTGTGLSARTVAQKAGAETVVLTTAHLPAHDHGGATGNDTHDHGAATGDNTHSHGGATGNDTHSHTGDSTVSFGVVGPGTALSGGGSHNVMVNGSHTDTGSTLGDTHSHTISGVTHSHTVAGDTHSHTISSVGSGTAHDNMPPWVGMHQIIRVLP